MNEELILLYLKRDSFSFQKSTLSWYTLEALMTKPVKKSLREMKIVDALIPGGLFIVLKVNHHVWMVHPS